VRQLIIKGKTREKQEANKTYSSEKQKCGKIKMIAKNPKKYLEGNQVLVKC
jgi:hypothetical protein